MKYDKICNEAYAKASTEAKTHWLDSPWTGRVM